MGCAPSTQSAAVAAAEGAPDHSNGTSGSSGASCEQKPRVTFEQDKPRVSPEQKPEQQAPVAARAPVKLGTGWSGVLTMKLAEAHVSRDEDSEEWALSRMEAMCRLAPRRLARKVMDERDGAIDQESFLDRTTCALLFIDYRRVSDLTTAMFKKQGIFVRPRSLAETLNKYLGQLVDTLIRGGGDVIKFAGDALMVAFAVTEQSDLSEQTLRATQLSLQCIETLQAAGIVEGVELTACSGIGVGDVTGFLVGGVFNRSEYAIIGDPVSQAASAEVVASDGETVISAAGWALLNGRAEGNETADGSWRVTSIAEKDKLSADDLGTISSAEKVLEGWAKRSKLLIDEIRRKCKDMDGINQRAEELKQVVPGVVRLRLREFTPTSIPSICELRQVTIVLVRVTGLDFEQGGTAEVTKTQSIVKLIQETVYVHDGNFMRFSVDDLGAVVMAIFGLPPTHENDPELAVACGIDIVRQIQSRCEEYGQVKTSVGIATGYCWLGLVGGVSRSEYTVQGPPNDTAGGLMCSSEDGVMIDLATKNACMQTSRNGFVFEARTSTDLNVRLPGLLRSSSTGQQHKSTSGRHCFLVSRNPSATKASKSKNGLVMKLSEGTVDAESDTQEWAVKRLEVLSRLAPYRLLRHVIEHQAAGDTSGTISLSSEEDQKKFYDRTTCAAMFIDISGFSKITRILFAEHGLDGVEILASTLNTYLGRIVDRLTQCGGDVIKFAGDAALVIFPTTKEADLATQTLKATQLSLECIADLEDGETTVAGVVLTAHTGIGVGDATGFLVGGVFNRSEYAIIGPPVFQIASAEPAAGDGETVVSPQAWALIQDHAEGLQTTDDNWLVTGIKPESKLDTQVLAQGGGIVEQLAALTKEAANLAAKEIKTIVPGGVRNRLPEFTPTSMPCMSEFRLVTMLFARIQGLDYTNGDAELGKIQTIVRIIQETIYKHDGIFLRFSVDDKGAVVMGCYGLPPSHANDPERGVMAALDFSRQIHTERKDDLGGVKVSVGLTTGYCWLGLVGGVSRCEYTTHAPIINLAARLMCSTDDEVTVDLATKESCQQTNQRATFQPRKPIQAKGFGEPVQVFIPRLIASTGLAMKHWSRKEDEPQT